MTCVECIKNRVYQMKELLCDNKENCEDAYQSGYNQALEDFSKTLKDDWSYKESDISDRIIDRIKKNLRK